MPKPSAKHASVLLREDSRKNLASKLRLLEKWATAGIPWACDDQGKPLRDADGERVLDYYPTSPSAFCKWNGEQNCKTVRASLGRLRTNSRDTLRLEANTDLRDHLTRTLTAIRAKAAVQFESSNKSSRLSKLRKEVMYWQTIAEHLTSERIEVTKKLSKLAAACHIAEGQYSRNQIELQRQLQMLRSENAALIKAAAQVTPIRDAKTRP